MEVSGNEAYAFSEPGSGDDLPQGHFHELHVRLSASLLGVGHRREKPILCRANAIESGRGHRV
jgi:hypothetical protein